MYRFQARASGIFRRFTEIEESRASRPELGKKGRLGMDTAYRRAPRPDPGKIRMTPDMPMVILPAALLLDLALGDPRRLPHPVRWMGLLITTLEPFFRKLPFRLEVCGSFFTAANVAGTWLLAAVTVAAAGWFNPWLRAGVEIVLMYYCISITSLAQAAEAVLIGFVRGGLQGAKDNVALIVGRDVQALDAQGVFRATVETVAENLVDGVAAPLFFAAIGGAPLCVAYKMVNTLDSMIGYKNEKYLEFGRAAARLDDAANFIPARLVVPFIALSAQILAQRGRQSFYIARRDGRRHASPNAGYPEAAFAGALGIKLGGPNTYGSRLVEKPFIGDSRRGVELNDIRKARDLMILSALLWFAGLYAAMIGLWL